MSCYSIRLAEIIVPEDLELRTKQFEEHSLNVLEEYKTEIQFHAQTLKNNFNSNVYLLLYDVVIDKLNQLENIFGKDIRAEEPFVFIGKIKNIKEKY